MKRYLKEIEYASIILLASGWLIGRIANMTFGALMVVVGLLLWAFTIVVKALDWQHYRRDNIVNICIMMGAIIAILEAQQQVDKWIREYGVRYFSELTNMACLTEEVGELARVIARKYGDQSFKAGEEANLEEEMADVLWVLICLANQTGVDLTEAFRKSMEKKTKRDSIRHLQNPKLKA